MWTMKSVLAILGIYVFNQISAQSGSQCTTPNRERATCKSIYDCPILLNAVRTTDADQLRFLRASTCGYAQSPLVCCGTRNTYGTVTISQTFTPNSLIPDRTACGFQESDRIYNGEDTDMDEFPWMALLGYEAANGQLKWSCGGTLISPRYILTAAHCVTGAVLQKIGPLKTVRLGEWNTDTTIDCITAGRLQICNEAPVDIPVESALPHEGYDNNDNNKVNDIALVRLRRSVSYTNYIRAICLPLATEASRVNETLIVAGWGRTESRSSSPVKQKLRIPVADKKTCTTQFSGAGVNLGNDQICAGGEAGKDSCKGDSGGPLMRTSTKDTTQWYIEGVVSFGGQCGTEGWPGIYTKVSSYLSWIHQNVKR